MPPGVNEFAASRPGAEQAANQKLGDLLPMFYEELRGLAARQLSRERADHTLQPTALVHEAFLRISKQAELTWKSRPHFFAVAARTIRSILVDHAAGRSAAKRGGGRAKLSLDADMLLREDDALDLLELDELLEKLSVIDPQKAEMVELRFFAGLTIEETASVLGVSPKTVQRDWRWARAWLNRKL